MFMMGSVLSSHANAVKLACATQVLTQIAVCTLTHEKQLLSQK